MEMDVPTVLLSLGDHALLLVLSHLPLPDRLRLSTVCRELRRVCRKSVQHLVLTQQDLEDCDGLSVFSHVEHLQFQEVGLDIDLVEYLVAENHAQLQQLTSLHISDPSSLDPSALVQLLCTCTALTSLEMNGGWPSDASLSWPLKHHNSLRRLALHSTQLYPLAYRCWLVCPHLHELDLSGCGLIGLDLAIVETCPELKVLSLASCHRLSNAALELLCKQLDTQCSSCSAPNNSSSNQNTRPSGSPGQPADTAAVDSAHWTGPGQRATWALEQFNLSYTRVSDDGMVHLAAAMPELQWLALKGCNVGDDGLVHLLQLQQLTALHIKHCHRITEEGIHHLSVLTGLQELSFGYTSMPEADDIAGAIATQFKELTGLNLVSSKLTDKGLSRLAQLQHLRQLKLYQASITCSGLQDFAYQPAGQGLQSLVLYGLGELTSLECLGAFPCLQDLQLGCLCEFEDVPTALQQLTSTRHLTALVLERLDGITLDALRRVLAGCRELLKVCVRGCDGVSQNQMEQLASNSARWCRSSASIYWAVSPADDTDDEEDKDQLLPP